MKSNYAFEKKDDHLYMTISGEYDFHDFKLYLDIIRDKCEEDKIYKVLFDAMKVEGIDIPAMERYFLGIGAAELSKYKIKTAVVWHKDYTNYIFETVAVNRGGNVKIFGNFESAVMWLLCDN